jgi:trans-2,3-dihydro-3-hydroxyanthranilate isomerase
VHRYEVVDAFTDTPLEGNPVAVFFDCEDLDIPTMQAVAAEMHLSETTFISGPEADGHARVRIFTPVNELAFAGHPLLGTALVLSDDLSQRDLRLETTKGTFRFRVAAFAEPADPHGGTQLAGHVEMQQPDPVIAPYDDVEHLLAALGLASSSLPVEVYDVGPRHVFVGLDDEETLAALQPDQRSLARHTNMAAVCFSPGTDCWRMRMFSPAYGVVEDAATGSAAGPFALHLARHGLHPFGQPVNVRQGVEMGRPSTMYGLARPAAGGYALAAGGDAVRVATGRHVV